MKKEIKIYYSLLKVISFLSLSILILLSSTYSIIKTYNITSLVLIVFSIIVTIYFGFILSIIKKPVITMNEDGVVYSPFGKPKFFIPTNLVVAILLRNTPNKRIILTIDPKRAGLNDDDSLENYLKNNVNIPSYVNLKKQDIPHMYGHSIAMRIELLDAKLNILNKNISEYFSSHNKNIVCHQCNKNIIL